MKEYVPFLNCGFLAVESCKPRIQKNVMNSQTFFSFVKYHLVTNARNYGDVALTSNPHVSQITRVFSNQFHIVLQFGCKGVQTNRLYDCVRHKNPEALEKSRLSQPSMKILVADVNEMMS
uniref:Uncharacterized protein n=1 Tax=Cucumis melo TaxID=3656 RepID=A0A9I9EA55_CUCME